METVNFAFMKIFYFLVKKAIFKAFLLFPEDLRHALRPKLNTWSGQKLSTQISLKRRNALKMAILTKKSKIFIKAKLTVSKSYLLGLIYLMIWCILRDAILQKVVYFKNESGTGVVFLALCMYLMVIIDNSSLFCLYIFVLEDLAFFPTV